MSITVDPEWWKSTFDEIYLITDARSVCDDEITRREIDLVCELLPMNHRDRILDLCGGHGRHSMELYRRGFTRCTLFDYSKPLIERARKEAARCSYDIECIRGDARSIGLLSETFDHVLIMGNSLGYIPEHTADAQILAEAMRILCPGGWLLIDAADGAAVKDSFHPRSWHEIGADVVVCRERKLEGNIVSTREIVLSKEKGMIRNSSYSLHLYDPQTLAQLVNRTGFGKVKVHTGFFPHQRTGDYGFMNHRMLATGQKP